MVTCGRAAGLGPGGWLLHPATEARTVRRHDWRPDMKLLAAALSLPRLVLVAAWLVWREIWVRGRNIGKP